MKNIIITFIISFLLGGITVYFLKKCKTKTITVEVEVPVPPIIDSFPYKVPVPKPYPVENPINKELAHKLNEANNIIDSLKVYKEFAVKRSYTEVFEDTIQTITVDAEATGTIDLMRVKYIQKERTIKVPIEIETPITKRSFTLYTESGLPLQQHSTTTPFIAKFGFDITNSKNWVYGPSYSTDGRFWLKGGKKFDF